MAPTVAFLVLLALMSNPFCFHQNGIIWAPNAPLLTLPRPILVIAACSHISYACNTHNNHKIASLRRTSRNHVRFKLHPKTTTPCWSGNKASLFIRPPDGSVLFESTQGDGGAWFVKPWALKRGYDLGHKIVALFFDSGSSNLSALNANGDAANFLPLIWGKQSQRIAESEREGQQRLGFLASFVGTR